MKTFTWVVISILLAVTTRFLLLGVYKVPSYSMSPSLQSGDYILVSKMAYGIRFPWSLDTGWLKSDLAYGDIVVVNFKKRQTTPYVKRIIGKAGDKIQISNGQVTLNGTSCEYLKATPSSDLFLEKCSLKSYEVELPGVTSGNEDVFEVVVPKEHVLVLNDARENKEDSRTLGLVQVDQIAGKVKFLIFSYGSTQDSISENKSIRWNRILTTP